MPHLDSLLPDLDDRFRRLQREARIPGVAWGVVEGRELFHAGGAGSIRHGEMRAPDADAVFRIASMTKSFTAATVLHLRDEGRLRLDEPVATYVPELNGWRMPTADTRPVTVRQLLTMSAGLPTDDPWGDRQQSLALDRFAALLASGPAFAWPPGTVFEYSNLGYGILGRVITNVAGREYREVVHGRLLRPLGMASTAYLAEETDPERLAHGYVRRGDDVVREGEDGYGALASMGGVFTSVRDLATWVAGFLDAFPARDDPEGPHPLRRASRREMQQVQRAIGPRVAAHPVDEEPAPVAEGYGLGLFIIQDATIGTTISHAGGYPGFGSHMAWHPATGLGVIGLGNLRYAPVRPVVAEMLTMLVRAEPVPRRRVRPLPAAAAMRRVVDGLITRWDDVIADRVFAMNMDLDEPREARRAAVEAIATDLGPFRPDESRTAPAGSPAHLAWWLRGSRGWVRVTLLVTPEPSPRIQQLVLKPVGDPSPALREIAERVVALTGDPAPAWPSDLALADDVDQAAVERMLRAAGTRFGSQSLGQPVDGDGVSATTFALVTAKGRGELALTIDPETGRLTSIALRVPATEWPPEAW